MSSGCGGISRCARGCRGRGSVLVVCQQGLETRAESRRGCPSSVEVRHYNNITGENAYSDVDARDRDRPHRAVAARGGAASPARCSASTSPRSAADEAGSVRWPTRRARHPYARWHRAAGRGQPASRSARRGGALGDLRGRTGPGDRPRARRQSDGQQIRCKSTS